MFCHCSKWILQSQLIAGFCSHINSTFAQQLKLVNLPHNGLWGQFLDHDWRSWMSDEMFLPKKTLRPDVQKEPFGIYSSGWLSMHQDIDFVRNQREACYNCSCFFLFSLAFFLLILFLYLDFGLFEYLSFSHVDQENFCSACDRRTVTFIEQWEHNYYIHTGCLLER